MHQWCELPVVLLRLSSTATSALGHGLGTNAQRMSGREASRRQHQWQEFDSGLLDVAAVFASMQRRHGADVSRDLCWLHRPVDVRKPNDHIRRRPANTSYAQP